MLESEEAKLCISVPALCYTTGDIIEGLVKEHLKKPDYPRRVVVELRCQENVAVGSTEREFHHFNQIVLAKPPLSTHSSNPTKSLVHEYNFAFTLDHLFAKCPPSTSCAAFDSKRNGIRWSLEAWVEILHPDNYVEARYISPYVLIQVHPFPPRLRSPPLTAYEPVSVSGCKVYLLYAPQRLPQPPSLFDVHIKIDFPDESITMEAVSLYIETVALMKVRWGERTNRTRELLGHATTHSLSQGSIAQIPFFSCRLPSLRSREFRSRGIRIKYNLIVEVMHSMLMEARFPVSIESGATPKSCRNNQSPNFELLPAYSEKQ